MVGETTSLGEVGGSGVAVPVVPRDGDEDEFPELALAPKNDANGLIRPNLAGAALSFASFSFCVGKSSGAALLIGGKGRAAVSADSSNEGYELEEADVRADRRERMVACRRAGSRIACINDESGGSIDSKQILLPFIVPSMPDSDTNSSSTSVRLASFPLLGRRVDEPEDTMNTI